SVQLSGRQYVGVDLARVDLEVLGGVEYPALGESGHDRVVDDEHVRGVALLRSQQHLVGQVGRVVACSFDRHAGTRAAGVDRLDPVGAVVELWVGIPQRVRASRRPGAAGTGRTTGT